MIFESCEALSAEPSQYVISCPSFVDFYIFFEELLEAAATYPWKKETKDKAIKLAADYIRFQVDQPQQLLSTSILLHVYKQLSLHHFLKQNLSKEIEATDKEMEQLLNERKTKAVSILKESCEDSLKRIDEEAAISQRIIEKIRPWTAALP